MTFHKSTRTHIEKRLLSVWQYKIIRYCIFFCVGALWCNKSNTAERNEWRRSFIPLYHTNHIVNQSTFGSEFSSTLLVPFAVLGTSTEGYQKVVRYSSLFWYHSQLLTIETDIIVYRTILYWTVSLGGNKPLTLVRPFGHFLSFVFSIILPVLLPAA